MFASARDFAQLIAGKRLAARSGTVMADALRRMTAGDQIIPLFGSPAPARGEADYDAVVALCGTLGYDPARCLGAYAAFAGSVPFTLNVAGATEGLPDDDSVVALPVGSSDLATPLSSRDFLRLRAL